MSAAHNVVLRGGVADGVTLYWGDVGSPIEWEDVGGGATTYVFADGQETVGDVSLFVYRLA
ncbi:hypothetical protein [Nocardioides sp. CER19]|uniref:hypothetical protein n=1 Tax=Nocardioides sp. CER19 TaxID=3038538 RepID=UPI00244B2CBD|nr:hypothetical protein [Nocardioides sp. CER19]MDH2416036.1 hypothetical protein [Nocardioides sp. CER19]